jgi:preprotein translocase subunit SecE
VGQQGFAFARESAAEVRKVVWPTRKETVQTTITVFILVVMMALFLWIVDVGFLWMVKTLMGRSA